MFYYRPEFIPSENRQNTPDYDDSSDFL